ncbi:MAG: PAS domain S-box protein [Alphaproteobacteria bacterium]
MTPLEKRIGFGWTFWVLVGFSMLAGASIVLLIVWHASNLNQVFALQHARDMTQALTVFRNTYSSEVVGRLDPAAETIVSHDYRSTDHAIPLPATLSIELAEELSTLSEGSAFRMVSEYPFPWRTDRALTDFEKDALQQFADGRKEDVSQVIDDDGGDTLAFARAVIMAETCVACHNNDPQSPKADWQIGDVRGIQVVTVPLQEVSLFGPSGLLQIVAFMVGAFAIAMLLLGRLIYRSRRDLSEIEDSLSRAEDSEARIRAVLDTTIDGIVTFDEDGVIETVNSSLENLIGLSQDELVGRPFKMLMSDADAERQASRLLEFESSGENETITQMMEIQGVRADKSTFPIELVMNEFKLAGRRMYAGIMRDVTTRKESEQQVREVETRLLEAIEALPDGFVFYDDEDRLVVCNSRYRDLYATSSEFMVPGATFEEIIRKGAERGQYQNAEEDRDKWIEERLRQHRNPGEIMEQHLDNGRWLRVIERRTDRGYTVGFRVDITELKQRQEESQRSEELLKRTFDAALNAIIIIDHKGNVIEFNPAAETMFGYKREDTIGKEMAKLIVPDKYRDAHRNGIDIYLETGHGPVIGNKIEIEAVRADGQEILVELAIQEATGADGSIFLGYMRDITEERANERVLVEAKEHAEEGSQAKAKFLAMMSHEIRTPLNGVLGMLNLLSDGEMSSQQKSMIKTARDSGKSLLAIINDILDYSKLEAGQMIMEQEVFSVAETVKAVGEIIYPLAAGKEVALETEVSNTVPAASKGDQGRLRQVLLNLTSNAVKFTEQGFVKIHVDAEAVKDGTARLNFRIIDTGMGVPDDKQHMLFSEFTTIDGTSQTEIGGTGLGLAISKSIVEAMDGEIGFESRRGEGSTFWFNVDMEVEDEALLSSEDTAVTFEPFPVKLRVLLAEDNATNQMVVTQMIEAQGGQVDVAGDGNEALQAVRKGIYDVILMDVSMPVLDGIGATKAIRAMQGRKSDLPIVGLTAYALKEDRMRFLAAGMDDVITKPIVRTRLSAKLHEIAAQVQKRDEKNKQNQEPVFDESIYRALMDDSDPDFKKLMLEQFIKDLRAQQTIAVLALQEKNISEIEKSSHVLKSVAGTLGAMHLSDLAGSVNNLARDGDHKAAYSGGQKMIELCGAVIEAAQRRRDEISD